MSLPYWLNDLSITFLNRGYLLDGVDPVTRMGQIASHAQNLLNKPGFAEKFYNYLWAGYYSLSSPIWANFGLNRGLPISCFGSYIEDSMISILNTAKEVGIMSKYGGGTSAYFGEIRCRGTPIKDNGLAEGPLSFIRLFDTLIDVTKQGSTRRGSFACYLPVDHPDIEDFLKIKTDGHIIQNVFPGVIISDSWMQDMLAGDEKKRKIWANILKARSEVGVPYLFFADTVNRNKPDVYKDKNLKIYASNLCSEIALPSNEKESFVCNLASLNLVHFDSWKDTDAVETLVYFLDAVMTDFIERGKHIEGLERAVQFAQNHRALGIGVLGYHDYLQSLMIPFDSYEAYQINNKIFKLIREKAEGATRSLAEEYGEAPLLKGYGKRNTTLLAIAPTTSSSFILGQTSQSIEPYRSNYYVKDLAKIKVTVKNKHLENLLEKRGLNTPSVWEKILMHNGSVQWMKELDDREKKVFETFGEISQLSIIQQAAQRQRYIDQSQSLNLMIHPRTSAKEIHQLHVKAWELGVKTLYYQHSINAAQEFRNNLLNCSVCES